ncbi:MAG: hypothetical protein AB3N16_05140 [Flavobacteriaceae bacterium]
MKKVLPFFALFLAYSGAMAQAYPSFSNPHEAKFNIGLFLATGSAEMSYEYYLNEDTSLGALIYFDGKPEDFNGNFGVGPFARAYFGNIPRSGPFAEAFLLFYSGEDEIDNNDLGDRNRDYSTTALGLGAGYKLVTFSNRFTLEANGGAGRNINPEDFQSSFVFRAGLSIGYRF